MVGFNDQNDLGSFLVSKGIDTSVWGSGETKGIRDLWMELSSGESFIQEDPLLRTVEVVQIVVRQNRKVLIENLQHLSDGRIRYRNILPSEKKHGWEGYLEAVRRLAKEELLVNLNDMEIMSSTCRQEEYSSDSRSYPGLNTHYIFHIVDVNISVLPTSNFWTVESDKQCTFVKKHLWVWLDEN